MSAPAKESDILKVALSGDCAFLKVCGRGSFKMGPALKQFASTAIERHSCARFVFDLRDCCGMDSTFMGVVAGLALRMRREKRGSVAIVNLSPKTQGLVQTLGLDRLIEMAPVDAAADAGAGAPGIPGANEAEMAALNTHSSSRLESVQTMLSAHRDLAALSPENEERFRDVIDYLSQDARDLDGAQA
jgi:anti-sigma B factor antagonist